MKARHFLVTRSSGRFALLLSLNLVLAGSGAWMWHSSRRAPHKGLVYSSAGFGGWVGEQHVPAPPPDPLLTAKTDYLAGNYAQAEREAEQVIHANETSQDDASQRLVAFAERVDAYSAAKRKDFATAKERFGYLRDTASHLKDKGVVPSAPGDREPTLEEEGAFQRAVCTSGMGEKVAAEAEFKQFMERYPKSILVHAAVKRIGRFHGGDIPKDAEAVWKQAMTAQQAAERGEARSHAMCAPQCLAELLRRQGKPAGVETLAREMGTNEEGTTAESLAQCLERHGYSAKGFQMTRKGFEKQAFPAVVLLSAGHYVLADSVSPAGVSVWDGSASPNRSVISWKRWEATWGGVVITLK